MVNWIGLAFPFVYLGILVGALSTFSSLYRKRKSHRAQSLAPWYESHPARDLYFSILHLDEPESGVEVPDSALKAALLRRAQVDVERVLQMRTVKPALATLLQRGSIGDDLWQRFLRAEQEVEAEIKDVVNEANAYAENWGQFIFQSAHEMAQNQAIRKEMNEIQSHVESEKSWWEQKRANVQSESKKDLDQESAGVSAKTSSKASDDDAVLVEAPSPASSQQGDGNTIGRQ